MTTVERYRLAPGLEVSRVITGLWQIADMEKGGQSLDPVRTAPTMADYVTAGLTTFDIADHYGSSEVIAGEFRATHLRGGACQLLTKWVPAPGPVSREQVRVAVTRSCERLRVGRIDLMQFHAWRFFDPSWLDALWFLLELKDEGLIAHLGVTNFDTAHLRVAVASGIDVVSNQVSCSLLDQRASGRMAATARRTGSPSSRTERWPGASSPSGGLTRPSRTARRSRPGR